MLAEIITIGDEILIGQTIDSNSAWIGKHLSDIGVSIRQISSISDQKDHIVSSVDEALARVDLLIVTGGLGPTRDDITKATLTDYFNSQLVMNEDVLKDVQKHFERRSRPMPEVNKYQAMVPEVATVFRNVNGTAPGMWFEKDGKVVVSLPGVPYEMKSIMEDHVIPKVKTTFELPFVYHRTVLTQGMGESTLMGIIQKWEFSLEELNIKLAYLPSASVVKLRLSAVGAKKDDVVDKVERKITELKELLGHLVYGEETEKLEEVVGRLLLENGQTLSTAESCTGGYLAHLITSIAGSSSYYEGTVVSYSNEVKIAELEVSAQSINEHGAVSEEVVIQMAKGVRGKMKTDYGIATSGVAGPSGGSEEKPVGTVWIAVAGPDGTIARKFQFGNHRFRNIKMTALTALNLLRKEIEK